MAFFRNVSDSPDQPTFAKPCCTTPQTRRHSPSRAAWTRQTHRHLPSHVARTRQTRRHLPNHFARTRQTRERQVWRVLHEFSEFGKFGEFSVCSLDHFIHIKYVICALNHLSCLSQHSSRGLATTRQTRQHSPSRAARTRQTRRHLPSHAARTRQTHRHSPTCFARTRQTRRHLPKAIFEKNLTPLAKFARVLSESRKFGASGHSLKKPSWGKAFYFIFIRSFYVNLFMQLLFNENILIASKHIPTNKYL